MKKIQGIIKRRQMALDMISAGVLLLALAVFWPEGAKTTWMVVGVFLMRVVANLLMGG